MAFNIATYIKNLGKSVAYAGADKIKEVAPATSEFLQTNEELFQDVYTSIRDYKQVFKSAKDAFGSSKVYETGDLLFKSVFEDIKSGKLYNRERESEIELKLLGKAGELDDFDNENFNFDDEFYNEEKEDNIVKKAIRVSSAQNATMVSESVARTGNALYQGAKTNTHILYSQNIKSYNMVNSHLHNLNENMSNGLKFTNEIFKTHAENSKKFYEEMTKASQAQVKLLSEITEILRPSNIQAKANEKDKNRKRVTIDDIIGVNGTPDIKEYAKYVKQNFKNEFGDMMPSNPFDDEEGKSSNMMLAYVASPLKFIPSYIIEKMIPKTLDESVKRLDKSISGFFGSLMSKANVLADKDEGNIITRYLGKLFGVKSSLKSELDVSKYEKGKMSWNGKAQKALTEVIPSVLFRIESLLSGMSERRYDYEKGKFVEYNSIKKEFKNKQQTYAASATTDMRSEFLKYAQFLAFQTVEDKKEFMKDMNSFFNKLYQQGGYFNINSKTLDTDYLDYGVSSKNFKILRAMFKNTDRYLQQQINMEILNQRSNQTKEFKNLEYKGDSIYNNLFNNSDELLKRDENGKIKDNKNPLNRFSLVHTKDNLGHNIFYYLQNIYKVLQNIKASGSGLGSILGGQTSITNFEIPNLNVNKKSEATIEREKLIREDNVFERESQRQRREAQRINQRVLNISDIEDEDIDKRVSNVIQRNKLNSELRNRTGKEKKPSMIDKLLASGTLSEKMSVVIENLDRLSKKPIEFLTNTLDKVDERLYQAIYGNESKTGEADPKGFINMMIWKLQNSFEKFNSWLDKTILNPIKEKINKEKIKDIGKNILGVFGIDADELWKNTKAYFFGNKDTGETGLFSSIKDGIKDSFKGAASTVKGAFVDTFSPTISKIRGKLPERKERTVRDLISEANATVDNSIKGHIERSLVPINVNQQNQANRREYTSALEGLFNSKEYQDIIDNSSLSKQFVMKKPEVNTKQRMLEIYEKYKPLDDFGYFNRADKKNSEEYYQYQMAKKYLNKKESSDNKQTTSNINLPSSPFAGKSKIIKNPFESKPVKESGETDLIHNFSQGLANVISDYLKKNITPHAEGSDEIKKPEIATLSKGERVLKANDSSKLNKIEEILDKLSNSKAADNLEKLLDKLTLRLNDNISEEDFKNSSIKEKLLNLSPELRSKFMSKIKSDNPKEETVFEKAAKEFYNASKKTKDVLFGKPENDSKKLSEAVNDVTKNISQYAPSAIGSGLVGAGVSLLTGAIGGPLLGAAVGAGISLTKDSEGIKSWLFGEMGENGERKDGAIVSKKTQDILHKFLPDMKRLGIVGAVGSLLPFVPFGPVGGLLIGSAVGFAKNTDVIKERMFGKAGIISEDRKDKIKKMVPRTLAALVPSLFLGPFGLLGNAVMGTGLGLLSNTEGFNKAVFGTYNMATKQNENGLLPMMRDTMVNPIKKFYNRVSSTLMDWIEDKIMKPVSEAIAPLSKSIELALKNVFTGVGKFIDNMFEKSIGIPLSRLVQDKIVKPATNLFGKVFNTLLKPVKAVVSSPFKLIGAMGNAARRSQIKSGNADYMTAKERIDYRANNDMRTIGQKYGRFSLGNRLFGKLGLNEDENGFEEFDNILMRMSSEDISKAYEGINTIRDTRKSAQDKRRGLVSEMGNQVSGYLGYSDGKAAMKAIQAGDLDKARHVVAGKRAKEKEKDTEVITKINAYVQGKDTNTYVDRSKLIQYINRRIDDPKTAKKMINLINNGKYDEVYKLIMAEEKRKDQAEKDMISYINSKSKLYEQLKNRDYSSQVVENDAYEELSKLGITGINKNNAQKYLDLLATEKKDREKSTVKAAQENEAGDNVGVEIKTGFTEVTEQDKKHHAEILDVFKEAIDSLNAIKKAVVKNDVTEYNKSDDESFIDSNVSNQKFRIYSSRHLKARKKFYDNIKGEDERKTEENEAANNSGLSGAELAGQHYGGGLVTKTGIGTISKGEFVFTPENVETMMNSLPNILDSISKDTEDENTIVNLVSTAVNKLEGIEDNTKEEIDKPITKIDSYGNVMKFHRVRNGDLEPDTSDSNTAQAIKKAEEADATQKGILDKLSGLGGLFDLFKKKDKGEDEEKEGILSKILKTITGGGLLSKLGLGLGATALAGGAGYLLNNTETGQELEKLWDKKVKPWWHQKAVPWIENTALPAIVEGIHTALTDGMPFIVHAVAKSVKFAVTEMYPALLKAVLHEIGLSGDDEESLPGNIAYAASRSLLTNGGANVDNFAKKYASNVGKEGAEKVAKKGFKATDILLHPLSTSIKAMGTATKEGAKLGTRGIAKVTSVLSKPVVRVQNTLDNVKLFKKLPSLKQTSSAITEKGLNATIKASDFIKNKTGVKAASAAEQASIKATEKTASTGLIKGLISDLKEFLLKIIGSSPVVKLVGSDGAEKLTTKFVPRFLEAVSQQLEKKGLALTGKLAASASTAGLANIAFSIAGFVSGYNNSRSILGITDQATFGQKITTGLLQAVMDGFLLSSLIPAKLVVNLVSEIILPLFGEDNTKLQKQREKAQKKVDAYNKKNKTNYNVEQYNKKVQGDESLWQKFKYGITDGRFGIRNNAKYVKNVAVGAIDFVKEHGVIGTMGYIGTGIADVFTETMEKIGKALDPIISPIKDIVNYAGQIYSTGVNIAWNFDLKSYFNPPDTNGTFGGFKKFLFYTNRVICAPVYSVISLLGGAYHGISYIVKNFQDLAVYSTNLRQSGIDTAWKLDWDGYWRLPQTEEGSPVSGFKKFLFYTDRILGAPTNSIIALGGAAYTGISNIIDGARNIYSNIQSDNKTIDKYIENHKDGYWDLPKTSGPFQGFQKFIYGLNRVIHAPTYYFHKLLDDVDFIKYGKNFFKSVKDTFLGFFTGGNNNNTTNTNGTNNTGTNNNTTNTDTKKKLDTDSKDRQTDTKLENPFKKAWDTGVEKGKELVQGAKAFMANLIGGKGSQSDSYLSPSQYKKMTTDPKFIKNPNLVYTLKGFNPTKVNNTVLNKGFASAKKAGLAIGCDCGNDHKPLGIGGAIGSIFNQYKSPLNFVLARKDDETRYPVKKNKKDATTRSLGQMILNMGPNGIGGDSVSDYQTGTASINAQVEALRPKVAAEAAKHGINDVDLLMALIQQEAGGSPNALANDPMQSAEGHGMSAGSLHDQDKSIAWGVEEFANRLSDTGGNIPLTLQSYNYGKGFIDYVKSNGGSMTQELVNSFSDQQAAKMGWKGYGDKQYVQHVLQYYKGDGSNIGNVSGSSSSASTKPTIASFFTDLDTMLTHAQNRFFGFDDSTTTTSDGTSGGAISNDGSVDANSSNPATDYFLKTMGGTLSSPYGARSSGMHWGIDIAAPSGTPIKSPIDGTVAANQAPGESGGFGNVIYLKDKKGNYSIFGHMNSRSSLAVGASVKQGDLIGYEGTTGHSTGPHLHYEVRKGSMSPGNSTDPNAYLKEYYSGIGGQILELAKEATMNAIRYPQGKQDPVPVEKKNTGGQTTTVFSNSDVLTKLINVIISILTKIADNTSNLSSVVKILTDSTGANVSQEDLQKLDTSSGKSQVASTIRKSLMNDVNPDDKLSNQKLVDLINSLASE